MAEQKSEGGGSPALNLNTLLALLTLGGSIWFVSQQLASDRPVTSAHGSSPFVGEQALEARLWEDPFKGDQESQRGGGMASETNFNTLIEQIKDRNKATNSVLLLPVMLSGGEYSEDQESRIRSRFAIVSALSRSGYAPDDAEHLGAVKIPWPTQREVNQAKGTNNTHSDLWEPCNSSTTNHPAGTNLMCPLGLNTSFQMDVHYEWYRRRAFFPQPLSNSVPPHVLVLWLDDSFFEDAPLLRLPLLLEPLLFTNGPTNVALIGPRRSSTLRAMLPGERSGTEYLKEAFPKLSTPVSNVLGHVEVYCATPSAMDEVLVASSNGMPRKAVGDALMANGFKSFHNFAATDAQLAKEVLDELDLRKIDLKRTNENHLVLISEWDTFYARMLSLTYAAEMAIRQTTNNLGRNDFVQHYRDGLNSLPTNFHSFVYLRGLDGQTVGGNPNARAAKESPAMSPTTSFEELRKWTPDANKAEGQAQFDYLGRLGDQLDELEDRLQRENGRVKIAVGIVGSDVYDTLLILQALRSRFPNFLFFTTDLDARFWHPHELAWSRNLIVASAYGLTLHRDLQQEVAPFRDSSQTAQFAAALAALGNTNLTYLTNIPPRRFEIGNYGAVDLSVIPGLLLGTNVAADTNCGPWLHPLTAQQMYQASTQEMTWSRAFELLPWPQNPQAKPGALRWTRHDALVRIFYGFGLVLVLACIFWQPLRVRTLGVVRFPVEVLTYRSCDVGGPDGVAELIKRLSADAKSHSAAPVAFLAEEWPKFKARDASPEANSAAPAAESDANQSPPDTEKTSSMLKEANAYAFVQFLNCLLRDRGAKKLPRRHAAFHWIMRPWENRGYLDSALDKLNAGTPDDSQQSVPCSSRVAARELFRMRLFDVLGFWFTGGIVVGLSCWVGCEILRDAGVAGSEPFSLVNGISGWPAILLRLAAVLVSLFFSVSLWSRMRIMFYELTRCYRFPLERESWFEKACRRMATLWSVLDKNGAGTRIKNFSKLSLDFILKWIKDHCFPLLNNDVPASGRVCAARLWQHYREGGHPLARALRAVVPCLVYFFLSIIIYQLFGSPFQPLRGGKDDAIFEWANLKMPTDGTIRGYMVVNISFFFLTFLTIDAALLCRQFIQQLSAGNVVFPPATLAHFRRHRGDVPVGCLDDWISTQLIADLTERVGKLLWLPGIVFLLLLIARLPWWDHWPWHPAHIIIMTLNFCITLASVVILQRAARSAKKAAEDRLTAKVKKLQAKIAASPAHNDAAQAEKLLEEVRNIRRGAFVSPWENPVLGALMVGPGGLTVLQLLIWFMNR